MYQTSNLMFMVCETPLHAGSGSDLDFIDNPIQRERHTGFPKIESSSLKGALKERFGESSKRTDLDFIAAFGPDNPLPGNERQGSLGFSDARLLLFPVKSMKGVFAWITCPFVLERFQKDMQKADGQNEFGISGDFIPAAGTAIVFSKRLVIGQAGKENIILEEYAFSAQQINDSITVGKDTVKLNDWLADKIFPLADYAIWNDQLKSNLVIVSDDDFADFAELTTEVITRNKIDPATGTVENGHLFTEEYLPTDSVLYSVVMAHPEFDKTKERKTAIEILNFFTGKLDVTFKNSFQAGGNATIGKGLIRTILMNTAEVNGQESAEQTKS